MPATQEFSEVVAGTPQLLVGAVKHHHEWVPKVLPSVYTDGGRHEGDGEAGSVYHYDIHDEAHGQFGGTPKLDMVMEDYNESTLSYVVNFQGDPRYSHFKYLVRFLPGPSPDTSTMKWVIDYSPVTEDSPPPDDFFINLPIYVFKDLEAHLESAKAEKDLAAHLESAKAEKDLAAHLESAKAEKDLAAHHESAKAEKQ